jgi:hypothetical protein
MRGKVQDQLEKGVLTWNPPLSHMHLEARVWELEGVGTYSK